MASSSAWVKGLPGGQLQRTTHAEMRTCTGPSRLILRCILRASAKHIPEAGGDEGLPSPALPWASLRAVAARPGGRSCMGDSCRAAPWGLGRPLCLWDPGVGAAGGRRSPCHTSFSFRLCDVCVPSDPCIEPPAPNASDAFWILAASRLIRSTEVFVSVPII